MYSDLPVRLQEGKSVLVNFFFNNHFESTHSRFCIVSLPFYTRHGAGVFPRDPQKKSASFLDTLGQEWKTYLFTAEPGKSNGHRRTLRLLQKRENNMGFFKGEGSIKGVEKKEAGGGGVGGRSGCGRKWNVSPTIALGVGDWIKQRVNSETDSHLALKKDDLSNSEPHPSSRTWCCCLLFLLGYLMCILILIWERSDTNEDSRFYNTLNHWHMLTKHLIQPRLAWPSWLSISLQSERSPVWCPVRAHAWTAG